MPSSRVTVVRDERIDGVTDGDPDGVQEGVLNVGEGVAEFSLTRRRRLIL